MKTMRGTMGAAVAVMAVNAACVAPALADGELPHWYAGISGGAAFIESSDLRGTSTGKANYSGGGLGTLTLGYMPNSMYQPLSGMRFELELGYHDNSVHDVTLTGGATSYPRTGAVQSFSYMANAYYDFHNPTLWTPYIGGGVGGARVMLSRNAGLGNNDNSTNAFAYQFMGGVSLSPPAMPKFEFNAGYRYFVQNDVDFKSATGKVKLGDLQSHNIEVGGRYKF